jgi:hypothetical protein
MKKFKVYNRQIKYPIVGVKPTKKTAHKIGKGMSIMVAEKEISVYDEEKIFALLYLISNGKAEITLAGKIGNILVVKITTTMYHIAKLLNNYNYLNILESLMRTQGMKIIYDVQKTEKSKKIQGKFIINPIIAIEPYQDGKITVYMEEKYYHFCLKSSMFLSAEYFAIKGGHTKNIYKFLIANQNQKRINIDTIAERCFFSDQPKKEQRRIVREALERINKTSIGKKATYILEKDYIVIQKFKKNKKKTETQQNQQLPYYTAVTA